MWSELAALYKEGHLAELSADVSGALGAEGTGAVAAGAVPGSRELLETVLSEAPQMLPFEDRALNEKCGKSTSEVEEFEVLHCFILTLWNALGEVDGVALLRCRLVTCVHPCRPGRSGGHTSRLGAGKPTTPSNPFLGETQKSSNVYEQKSRLDS